MNKKSNKSILSWLMGLSMLIAAPAAMADKGDHNYGSQKFKHSYKQNQKRAHGKKHVQAAPKKVVKAHKHNKKHFNNHHPVKKYGWKFTVTNNKPYYSNHRHRQSKRNKFAYHTQQIRKRQANQKRRIRKGINKGQLVRFERKELRQQQRRISNRIANFSSDRRLNRHERTRIYNMLDRADSNIRNKRHNRYTRHSHQHGTQYQMFAYNH